MKKLVEKGKMVEVLWFDACDQDRIENYEAMRKNIKDGTELLVKNKTYGILKDVFEKVIVIQREKSTDGSLELTVIPRGWIIKPKELRSDVQC